MPISERERLAYGERHKPIIDDPVTYGPGPLSPAWPRREEPAAPINEWEEMERNLIAIRSGALAALHSDDRNPYFLTLEERACLEASVLELKRACREILTHPARFRDIEEWPTPVLPKGVLLGARDIISVLNVAITCAGIVSRQVVQRQTQGW